MQPSKRQLDIYDYIGKHPGVRRGLICEKFGINRSIESLLAGFEPVGLYLYEDQKGRLFIAEAVNG